MSHVNVTVKSTSIAKQQEAESYQYNLATTGTSRNLQKLIRDTRLKDATILSYGWRAYIIIIDQKVPWQYQRIPE